MGHFTGPRVVRKEKSDLEALLEGNEFGYWMRTGNRPTNQGTGQRYEEVFCRDEMRSERRVISHATDNPAIDSVMGDDGRKYSVSEALEKKINWIQIDIGFLSDQEKDTVLSLCKYAVVNGSHTAMGEIMGEKSKPIIGIPVYDEHTNNIRWAEEKNLGVLATNTGQVTEAIARIRESLEEFSDSFVSSGAENSARIAAECLR